MSNETPGPAVKEAERRKYYRINDVVMLRYEILNETPGRENTLSGESGLEVSTGTLLAELDRELNQTINIVWQDNPAVAKALGLLNRKVSVVAAQALEYEQGDVQSYDDTMVSLSGCGIAFESREAVDDGERVRISVILRPSQITLSIAGTVIGCEKRLTSPVMPYWVRVDFDDDLMTQEQLIQHVVQKQGALLSESATMVNNEDQ
ncbi:MAG: PilZ domain-containing protein [Congregibacter sp.]